MRPIHSLLWLPLALLLPAYAHAQTCAGFVYEDRNANGRRDRAEPGLAGVGVSDGVALARTDAQGRYALTLTTARTVFVVKPAGYRPVSRSPEATGHWHAPPARAHIGTANAVVCGDFALRHEPRRAGSLDVIVFADPQAQSVTDVGYYERDIIDSVLRESPVIAATAAERPPGDLGITLGDIVGRGATGLYPAIDAATAKLRTPWLNVAGNHDVEPTVADDVDALRSFERHYGPDTFAWEEHEAAFVLLDNVISQPGRAPAYTGGFRADQFAFLEQYLATLPHDRMLVVAVHMPLFDPDPSQQTFRTADRERLFALLQPFRKVLVLSGHAHAQRHFFHDARTGWHGGGPLHEYNVGAASGAYWSGVKDAAGIPDATMSDGTPNGYARLKISHAGGYALSWHPARLHSDDGSVTQAMGVHAPRVLRRGAYPAWGVYANMFMGRDDTRVEFRVDEGPWRTMRRVEAPDPRLVAENVRDDEADTLRGYDRSPEAKPSHHLWRGALPTDLAVGEHRVEIRAMDAWTGEQRATTRYRLQDAAE